MPQHRAQRDVHLHGGEGRADAAARAAAERDPLVEVGPRIDEPVRVEPACVREHRLVPVQQGDAREYELFPGQPPTPDLQAVDLHRPADEVDHRPGALHLGDRGVPQRASPRIDLGGELTQQGRVSADPFDGPRQRRGRGLVSGGEQGEQLVGDLAVGHRAAVLVAGLQHQREHVVAFVEVPALFGLGDEPLDDGVELVPHDLEPAPGAPPPEVDLRDRQHGEPRSQRDQAGNPVPQPFQLRALGAEHRAQDDVQRDPHPGGQGRERRALRPCGELAPGLLLDDALVRREPAAVERGHQQLALAAVPVAGQREHRTRTEQSAEIRFHVLRAVGFGLEQLLDLVRIAEHDRAAEQREVHREGVPVAVAQGLHPALRGHDRVRGLQRGRQAGPGRQGLGRHRSGSPSSVWYVGVPAVRYASVPHRTRAGPGRIAWRP